MDPLNIRKQKAMSSSMWSSSSSSCGAVVSALAQDDLEDTASKSRKRKRRRRPSPSAGLSAAAVRAFAWCSLMLALVVMFWLFLEVCHFSQDHHNHSILPRRLAIFSENNMSEVQLGRTHSSIDNLDMPMRTVAGVKEPCLKLLPSEVITMLEFPPPSSSPVKSLHYKEAGQEQEKLAPRDLSFTGNQTLEEREESFKVTDAMEVHCGFCSKDVFTIKKEDKVYLNSCEVVVATCNFGGGDDIHQPINMTEVSLSKVCYVAFWDKVTMEAAAVEGKTLDISHKIGHWHIILVENLPFADQRLNGKIPKMLGHRLFGNAKYSIWVDSKSQFRRDPLGVLEALLWRMNSTFAISEHGARDCVYKEGEAIVRKHKATPEEVAIQLMQYRSEGFPERAKFDGHKALAEASVIIREHTPLTNLFMCLWFNEVTRFTARDQLSFPYVLRRLSLLHVNMFPVCTRKALVNSLGHIRKAKPLDTWAINM